MEEVVVDCLGGVDDLRGNLRGAESDNLFFRHDELQDELQNVRGQAAAGRFRTSCLVLTILALHESVVLVVCHPQKDAQKSDELVPNRFTLFDPQHPRDASPDLLIELFLPKLFKLPVLPRGLLMTARYLDFPQRCHQLSMRRCGFLCFCEYLDYVRSQQAALALVWDFGMA
jgi:hypothetical protein